MRRRSLYATTGILTALTTLVTGCGTLGLGEQPADEGGEAQDVQDQEDEAQGLHGRRVEFTCRPIAWTC